MEAADPEVPGRYERIFRPLERVGDQVDMYTAGPSARDLRVEIVALVRPSDGQLGSLSIRPERGGKVAIAHSQRSHQTQHAELLGGLDLRARHEHRRQPARIGAQGRNVDDAVKSAEQPRTLRVEDGDIADIDELAVAGDPMHGREELEQIARVLRIGLGRPSTDEDEELLLAQRGEPGGGETPTSDPPFHRRLDVDRRDADGQRPGDDLHGGR